jgi:hypothetical protein
MDERFSFLRLLVYFFCEARCDRSRLNISRNLTNFGANQMASNSYIFTISLFVIILSAPLSVQLSLVIALASIKSIAGIRSWSLSNLPCAFWLSPAIGPTDRNFTTVFEIVPVPVLWTRGLDDASRMKAISSPALSWFSSFCCSSPVHLWELAHTVLRALRLRCTFETQICTGFDIMMAGTVYSWLSSLMTIHSVDVKSTIQIILFKNSLLNAEW